MLEIGDLLLLLSLLEYLGNMILSYKIDILFKGDDNLEQRANKDYHIPY